MKDIADPDKFFNVSNYAGLDDILSSLQQSLIGIEGKKVFNIMLYNRERHFPFEGTQRYGNVSSMRWCLKCVRNHGNSIG